MYVVCVRLITDKRTVATCTTRRAYGQTVATRRVAVDQLVGTKEIAERLGGTRTHTIHMWRSRYPDFPAPVATLAMGHVWHWPDVEKWAHKSGRL